MNDDHAIAPGVFTVAPGVPFVDAVAHGIATGIAASSLALARVQVLLPTRRGCRALSAAFLRLTKGAPLLLPRMRPLGELDDDDDLALGDDADDGLGDTAAGGGGDIAAAISPLRRQLLLTRLVIALSRGETSADQAARLARELARLLDQVQTERLDLARLKDLVPAELAHHWHITLDFLAILTEHWPRILAEENRIDPAERRIRLIEAQTAAWHQRPPAGPVIAAGSTGSIPATAELLAVIARLPEGRVILPGLDTGASDATWQAILDDPFHPQFGMARLLARLKLDRRAVPAWPASLPSASPAARAALIHRALRPAATFAAPAAFEDAAAAGLEGVVRIDCPGPEDEARVAALILRRALDQPGQTAALVTPSRPLARRVAAELRRWRIEIDDSAGRPLGSTQPGAFLRLVARMVADGFAPVPLLAALKHPLAGCGLAAVAARRQVRRLECRALRGPRPAPGIAGLRAALGDKDADLSALLASLERATAAFAHLFEAETAPLLQMIIRHAEAAEALAATAGESGAARLWTGEAGEATAEFVAAVAEAAEALGRVGTADYPALLDVLMQGAVVRPRFGRHPRLAIWGPLEARLQHADVMILGGLNEDTWPPKVEPSPWMSRPMMRAFGLPLPERRIGLSAHDFAQAFCARAVHLTRARREDGTPTVPCRWLLRLDLFTQGTPWAGANAAEAACWLAWQRELDAPAAADRVQITPPAPRPPVSARPRKLSVTQIETWMRDPYAIYARFVLGLRALDPLDADPAAADYGAAVHQALDAFARACPAALPADASDRLLAFGLRAFAPLFDRPGVRAFWWPRYQRIASWFLEGERRRRGRLAATLTEVEGSLALAGPAGPFTLTAKADRIDHLASDTLAIIDYKTGTPPSRKDVHAGFAPQLPLEAAIAQAGGFAALAARPVTALEYWRLTGGTPAGKIEALADGDDAGIAALIEGAVTGLRDLIEAFDRPETAYLAQPRPSASPRYSDYAHLARVREWSAGSDDGG